MYIDDDNGENEEEDDVTTGASSSCTSVSFDVALTILHDNHHH